MLNGDTCCKVRDRDDLDEEEEDSGNDDVMKDRIDDFLEGCE